jgi:hypothetical protein
MGWLQWIAVATATYVRFKKSTLKELAYRQPLEDEHSVPYRTAGDSACTNEEAASRLQGERTQ